MSKRPASTTPKGARVAVRRSSQPQLPRTHSASTIQPSSANEVEPSEPALLTTEGADQTSQAPGVTGRRKPAKSRVNPTRGSSSQPISGGKSGDDTPDENTDTVHNAKAVSMQTVPPRRSTRTVKAIKPHVDVPKVKQKQKEHLSRLAEDPEEEAGEAGQEGWIDEDDQDVESDVEADSKPGSSKGVVGKQGGKRGKKTNKPNRINLTGDDRCEKCRSRLISQCVVDLNARSRHCLSCGPTHVCVWTHPIKHYHKLRDLLMDDRGDLENLVAMTRGEDHDMALAMQRGLLGFVEDNENLRF